MCVCARVCVCVQSRVTLSSPTELIIAVGIIHCTVVCIGIR